MKFELLPYVGPLPIRFGMTPAEVESHLGPAEIVGSNFLGERDEIRKEISIRYSPHDSRVCEVAFTSPADLRLNDLCLFKIENLVDKCKELDPHPYEVFGFMVFTQIGIALTGFHDNDIDQRSISVFREGRWDKFIRDHT